MIVDDNAESIRVLAQISKGIEGLRRRLQEVQPDLSTSTSEVVNTARQALCTALVRRLEIAEKELVEPPGNAGAKFKGVADRGWPRVQSAKAPKSVALNQDAKFDRTWMIYRAAGNLSSMPVIRNH